MSRSKYPNLRTHVRRGKNGQAWTWYTYDRRSDPTRQPGEPVEAPLGKDYAKALELWDKWHNKKALTRGTVQEAIDQWIEECIPEYELEHTRSEYTRQIKNIAKVFGKMAWREVTLPHLVEYLRRRKAKTQGNREMSVFQIVWGKARIWGKTALPWPAQGVKKWKNKEYAREFEVTNELFQAVYDEGDAVLRDCMDLASATAMRLTDTRTVKLPRSGELRFRSGKTGKPAYFTVAESPVLQALVDERLAREDVTAPTLIVTERGHPLSARMLRERYDAARAKAADKATREGKEEFAELIRAMYLRDMRKMAADLAEDEKQASELLQHGDVRTTRKHYRTKGTKLTPVR